MTRAFYVTINASISATKTVLVEAENEADAEVEAERTIGTGLLDDAEWWIDNADELWVFTRQVGEVSRDESAVD